tara:strand:+ start:306 stop:509 length:204 start_codon:yes stop_codon:yes gene_type:complete
VGLLRLVLTEEGPGGRARGGGCGRDRDRDRDNLLVNSTFSWGGFGRGILYTLYNILFLSYYKRCSYI